MTSLRAFRPQDLFRFNLTNLDPLTENYGLDYYFQYLFKWPSLFTCTEDQHSNITGYGMAAPFAFPLAFSSLPVMHVH